MNVCKKTIYRGCAWGLVVAYMGLIFWLSSLPGGPPVIWFPHQDKVLHFLEYHMLAFFLAHAVAGGTLKRRFWIAFTVACVYGITDELHQSFVPGRDCSVWDWCADMVGAWLGAHLYLKSESVLRRSRAR